ncbi:hypothetical protein DFJ43DRAFT_718482 [Lentinula guzmanii]|uniref:Uncharacterized protein n=1 Tax=Lentinula guzmanii TaxID=2804957 RepID=A0AA38JD00_9AGAR|nr:hypothetical protein DFJ43DRAFT_718482 [Lentinula guzmanii]
MIVPSSYKNARFFSSFSYLQSLCLTLASPNFLQTGLRCIISAAEANAPSPTTLNPLPVHTIAGAAIREHTSFHSHRPKKPTLETERCSIFLVVRRPERSTATTNLGLESRVPALRAIRRSQTEPSFPRQRASDSQHSRSNPEASQSRNP